MQGKILDNPRVLLGLFFFLGMGAHPIAHFLKSALKSKKKVSKQDKLYVGIELGGTNFSVGIGVPHFDESGKIVGFSLKNQMTGRTDQDNPENTVNQIRGFLKNDHFEFIGICSFGPLCLDQKNPKFGYITSTPKTAYADFPILQQIQSKTNANHYGFDTDVNAPAFAEFHLGNHDVKDSLVYVTVGTGVGIGVIANKKTVHGLVHPEGGHIIVKRHPEEDPTFKGVCPFHGDCLEGLVTNHSIATRIGKDIHSLHTLDDSEKVWTLVGYYLAQLCLNLTLILSPQVILIGGGIMNRKIIFQHIYRAFPLLLNEYVDHPKLKIDQLSKYIREPKLSNVGLIGAMMLRPIVDHHGHADHQEFVHHKQH